MPYTTINDPSAHFQTALYTGSSSSVTVTNDGNSNLQPDFLWIKSRSSTNDHNIFDACRGFTKRTWSNQNSAQTTGGTQAAATDGFTTGTYYGDINTNGANYAAWQFKAGGATPSKTYRVVVVSDSGNKYRFRNSTNTATFAQSAVTLDLQEGGTYTFDASDSSVSSHPFVLGTAANSSEYSTGVTYKLDGVTKTYSQYTSGFSAASSRQLIITVAASAPTLYYWCSVHSGMGGQVNTNSEFGSTNFDGTILSISSENTTSGFSIVRHTGTGSAGNIGHGLGSIPQVVMTKNLSSSADWAVYNEPSGNGYYLRLNTDDARTSASSVWGDTTPTALDFRVGGANTKNNSNGDSFISYCFTSVKGFSKINQYNGNNNADGPFVYTGFKPAFIILKNTVRIQNWRMYDLKRPGFNSLTSYSAKTNFSLRPNGNSAENSTNQLDILSNGFKFRSNDGDSNGYNEVHLYMAFAEHPFVSSNNVVATAR